MRYGPILVPIIIVGSVFVIVGAESGWFDGAAPDVAFVQADRVPLPDRKSAAPDNAAPAEGRSAGTVNASSKDLAPPAPGAEPVGQPASPDESGLLARARAETAKARQDVLDATRAAMDAQSAADAEAARQKTEFDDQIALVKAKLESQSKDRAASEEASRRLQSDLTSARDEATSLKRQLAERSAAAPGDARLRDDLDGARRGEATLREENTVLQRELVQAKQAAATPSEPASGRSVADGRSAAELSAALRDVRTELEKIRKSRPKEAAVPVKRRRVATPAGLPPPPPVAGWGARLSTPFDDQAETEPVGGGLDAAPLRRIYNGRLVPRRRLGPWALVREAPQTPPGF